MEKRPTKCPICGSKITRVTNAVTKNYYFKCTNEKCHFVLGKNYTEAEFYLQGTRLQSCCIECGKNLTLLNGPTGLYAKCHNCERDSIPTMYNGKTYKKYVNTHRDSVKKEIESIIKSFEQREDEQFDFETYIAQPSKDIEIKKSENLQKDTIASKIISYISTTKKPVRAQEISEATGAKLNSVRTNLLLLRSSNVLKIVDYAVNPSGNHTLFYQTIESDLPELKVYTKEDGYNTIASFIKEIKTSVAHPNEALLTALKKNNIEPVLFSSKKGMCAGYKVSDMEKVMDLKTTQLQLPLNKIQNTRSTKDGVVKSIMSTLAKNLRRSYSTAEIASITGVRASVVKKIINNLRKNKKIKIVDWNYTEGQQGAAALKYQLVESPLEKLKTTIDNNVYMTFGQFYKKRLAGKRCTSKEKAIKEVRGLTKIPLIIKQRAYAGYALSDLKEVFKEYLEPSPKYKRISIKRKTKANKETEMPMEVQAAILASHNSNKGKGLLDVFSSLFNKKEKSSINC